MRVLIVHNYYQQAGGEDVVFEAETNMLREHGHAVYHMTAHNDAIQRKNPLAVAANAVWSRAAKRQLAHILQDVSPEIVHFHNTFMSISPSAYYACREAGVPVIQTLHNYRLLCPAATLYRDEGVCTDCIGRSLPWPGIMHGCYRDSRLQSAGVTAMLSVHHLLQTWDKQIDTYISLTEFGREQFIEGGLQADKIVVKPNTLPFDPGFSSADDRYMLFVGRLAPEKGLRVLLHAWRHLPDIPLKIIGDGPLWEELQSFIADHDLQHVELLGSMSHAAVIEHLHNATALLFPSQWYEPFGLAMWQTRHRFWLWHDD